MKRAGIFLLLTIRWGGFVALLSTGQALGSVEEVVHVDTPASKPPSVAIEYEPLFDAVRQALDMVGKYSLPYEWEQGSIDIIQAVLRAADPGVQVLEISGNASEADRRYGIGISMTRSNGSVWVRDVFTDSPAAAAGVVPGDRVRLINQEDAGRLNITQLDEAIRGDSPGRLALGIQTGEDEPREVDIERAVVSLPALAEHRELPAQLGYVRLRRVDHDVGATVSTLLTDWADQGSRGIILDLRGAGGESLEAVVKLAGLVSVPGETLFSFRNAKDQDLDTRSATGTGPLDLPIMALVDAKTRGAAEVFTAILASKNRRAIILGERTSGNPLVRSMIPISDGVFVNLAIRRLVVSDGTTYTGMQRVEPDIAVDSNSGLLEYAPLPPLLTDRREITKEELEAKALRQFVQGDATLVRAVDILLGLHALNLHGLSHAP